MVFAMPRLRVRILIGSLFCFLLLSAATQTSAAQTTTSLITQSLDETRTIPLAGNIHPLATAAHDQGVAEASTPTGRIELVLKRSPAQQVALKQYLADVQSPSSGQYHKWMTPAQYGAAFGISDGDLDAVEEWLTGHGFKVDSVSPARNVVEFSGTFGQVNSAFHTSMHKLSAGGASHFANMSNPAIPEALAPVIGGVGPLNDFHPTALAKLGSPGRFDPSRRSIQSVNPDLTLFSGTGTPYLYVVPADAATIYDTPNATLNPAYNGTTYDGTGVKIGVAGDSNILMQDVANYRVAFLRRDGGDCECSDGGGGWK